MDETAWYTIQYYIDEYATKINQASNALELYEYLRAFKPWLGNGDSYYDLDFVLQYIARKIKNVHALVYMLTYIHRIMLNERNYVPDLNQGSYCLNFAFYYLATGMSRDIPISYVFGGIQGGEDMKEAVRLLLRYVDFPVYELIGHMLGLNRNKWFICLDYLLQQGDGSAILNIYRDYINIRDKHESYTYLEYETYYNMLDSYFRVIKEHPKTQELYHALRQYAGNVEKRTLDDEDGENYKRIKY